MKARHLVRIRRLSQVFFLALFVFLMVEAKLPQEVYQNYSVVFQGEPELTVDRPVAFFFELDPLVALTSLLSGQRLVQGLAWAVAVVVMTFFLGRIFCGFICPFGTVQHAVGAFSRRRSGPAAESVSRRSKFQRIKYFILIVFLLSALFGLNVAGWADPIAFLFRSVGLAVLPGLGEALKWGFDALAYSEIKLLNLLSYGAEVLVAPVFGYGHTSYQGGWIIGGLFLLVLFLNRIQPRFWCRYLCPLGALLGLLSRVRILRLEKNEDACTHCGRCTAACQGAASPEPGEEWSPSECVACFNCFATCPEDALEFRLGWTKPHLNPAPDVGRRAVLGGLLGGVSLPFLGKLDHRITGVPDARLIRPPGAVEEKEFLELCQRCGLCMKVCPTNAVVPTLSEAGMAGVWTPRLDMLQGYCEYACTLCGSVCPTGAIEHISVARKIKEPVRIGSAYLERGRCLPWSGNASCIVCQEVCPTSPKAIYLRRELVAGPEGDSREMQLPYVNLEECVGCGVCEFKCPVRGRPAIRVISAGESRSLENRILL